MKSIPLPSLFLGLCSWKKDFQTKATPVDFFYAKGIVEALFDKLEVSVTMYRQKDLAKHAPQVVQLLFLL